MFYFVYLHRTPFSGMLKCLLCFHAEFFNDCSPILIYSDCLVILISFRVCEIVFLGALLQEYTRKDVVQSLSCGDLIVNTWRTVTQVRYS